MTLGIYFKQLVIIYSLNDDYIFILFFIQVYIMFVHNIVDKQMQ